MNWLGKYRSLNDSEHRSIQFLGAGYKLLSPIRLKKLAHEWESKKEKKGPLDIHGDYIKSKIDNRKLRICYLSGDFCKHPVGRFVLPLIRNHDRNKTWVACAYTGLREDELTEELKENCDMWINLKNCSSDLQQREHLQNIKLTFWLNWVATQAEVAW